MMADSHVMHEDMTGREILGYRLLERLGSGAMGTVWRAEQPTIGTVVAIKLLDPALARNPGLVKRFVAEAQVQTGLTHPGIVRALNFSTDPLAIVLEFVPGHTLEALLGSPMPPSVAIPLIRQVLSALGHAHGFDIVHRDVKPSNVLVTPQGQAKVMDFGIAKIRGGASAGTRTGTTLGTPLYMAPEQVQGLKTIDHRADIYSTGAMLWVESHCASGTNRRAASPGMRSTRRRSSTSNAWSSMTGRRPSRRSLFCWVTSFGIARSTVCRTLISPSILRPIGAFTSATHPTPATSATS